MSTVYGYLVDYLYVVNLAVVKRHFGLSITLKKKKKKKKISGRPQARTLS